MVDGVEGLGGLGFGEGAVVGFGGLLLAAQAFFCGDVEPLGDGFKPSGDDRAISGGVFYGATLGAGDEGSICVSPLCPN